MKINKKAQGKVNHANERTRYVHFYPPYNFIKGFHFENCFIVRGNVCSKTILRCCQDIKSNLGGTIVSANNDYLNNKYIILIGDHKASKIIKDCDLEKKFLIPITHNISDSNTSVVQLIPDVKEKIICISGSNADNIIMACKAFIFLAGLLKDYYLVACDFHLHSNHSDGHMSVQEIIDEVNRLGLDIIAITDHHSIKGAIEAQGIINKLQINFPILVGIEISTNSGDHILGLGLRSPSFLKEHSTRETIIDIRSKGGVAVVAHFSHPSWFEKIRSKDIDGAEIDNYYSSTPHMMQKFYRAMAKNNKYFIALGNSDAHFLEHIAKTKTYFLLSDLKEDCILERLKQGKMVSSCSNGFIGEDNLKDFLEKALEITNLLEWKHIPRNSGEKQGWNLSRYNDEHWNTIEIDESIKSTVVWYRKKVKIKNERVLSIEGASGGIIVYVNGKFAKSSVNGELWLDLAEYIGINNFISIVIRLASSNSFCLLGNISLYNVNRMAKLKLSTGNLKKSGGKPVSASTKIKRNIQRYKGKVCLTNDNKSFLCYEDFWGKALVSLNGVSIGKIILGKTVNLNLTRAVKQSNNRLVIEQDLTKAGRKYQQPLSVYQCYELSNWKFSLDQQEQGIKCGWHKPSFNDQNWVDIKAASNIQAYGYQYYGTMWYRKKV